jgi:beta-lactamase regulating signal transducer with metallopeptidase domain
MHEHVARTMYYFGIHMLYASIVACAALTLTSIRGGSATTKYWIWVVTTLNFMVPTGALIDRLWAPHLTWAVPLGIIGDAAWNLTQGRTAAVLALVWVLGATALVMRLVLRIRAGRREDQSFMDLQERSGVESFLADGVPVNFDDRYSTPAVQGVLRPRISLPGGLDRLLSQQELDAVLMHELAHARRRDNLISLLYEVAACVLWFHPLVWLAGARMSLYRELSCDESVIENAHGRALVSALAKLAAPEKGLFLQTAASSHLSYRLDRLVGPPQQANRAASMLLSILFVALLSAGIFETVAHTACCFVLKR